MTISSTRRQFLRGGAALGVAAMTLAVGSEAAMAKSARLLSANEAFAKAKSGEVLLIDIRHPDEWKQTGVGKGAFPVSMHKEGFLQRLISLTGGDKSRPVALICATGSRSKWLQKELEKRGYNAVTDVSEGMEGSRRGPGWLKLGLPVARWSGR